jgi:hypothetical protein
MCRAPLNLPRLHHVRSSIEITLFFHGAGLGLRVASLLVHLHPKPVQLFWLNEGVLRTKHFDFFSSSEVISFELSTLLRASRYSYMIDNVILLITGTLHDRDTHEVGPRFNCPVRDCSLSCSDLELSRDGV